MKSWPIIFSAPMIRALIEGRKTQTRRLAWKPWEPSPDAGNKTVPKDAVVLRDGRKSARPSIWQRVKPGDQLWVKEAYSIVKESTDYETGGEYSAYDWEEDFYGDPQIYLAGDLRGGHKSAVYFPADGEDKTPSEMWPCIGLDGKILCEKEIPWRNPLYMPRWASRITLTVTETRRQPLRDITEEDALAEGATSRPGGYAGPDWSMDWSQIGTRSRVTGHPLAQHDIALGSARFAFLSYWNDLHGKPGDLSPSERNPEVVSMTFTVAVRA